MTSIENDISMIFVMKPRFDFQNRQEIFDAVFIGTPKKFSAVTMNYQKRVATQRDTNIREIEYYVLKDKTANEGEPAFSLMKKKSSFLDEELFGPGIEYAVLTDLKSFSFRYYFEKDRTWLTEWDSRRGNTKNIAPRAVEVTFEIYQRDPDDPDKKPKVLFFQTKFLADSVIERSRLFELSKNVQQLQQLAGSKQGATSSGSSSSGQSSGGVSP